MQNRDVDLEELAHRILEASNQNQEMASKAIKGMALSEASLSTLVENAPQLLTNALNEKVQDITDTAAKDISARLEAATIRASEVVHHYNKLMRWSYFRVLMVSVVICTVVTAFAVGIAQFYIPSPSELMELRSEKQRLQSEINSLKPKGAVLKFVTCPNMPGRSCVEVEPSTTDILRRNGYLAAVLPQR